MRKKNPILKLIGILMISVGALLLFARVLPPGFWWFCVGVSLIAGGICLLKKGK